ncbi:MAG: hypothetical protein QXN55_01830 [Candidatus Nitrosotenuis sp.]
MGFPLNPLDKYRTYAFHHILLVSNSSESIRKFLGQDSKEKGGKKKSFLEKLVGGKIGQNIAPSDEGGEVYLLIDTRKTSDFSIKSVSYKTIFGAGSSPSDTHVFDSLLKMEVTDVSGIGFLNYIQYLVDEKLQTDISGMIFLLHTTFIGHTDEGQTEFIEVTDIPMIFSKGSMTVTERGSEHEIDFLPITIGSLESVEMFAKFNTDKTIFSKDSTLGAAIQSLENNLNKISLDYFNYFNADLKSATSDDIKKSKDLQNGRLVQYMITIPKSWESFKIDTTHENSPESNFKSLYEGVAQTTGESGEPAKIEQFNGQYFNSAVNMSIFDAIYSLLRATPDVNAMASLENKTSGNAKIFKTVSSVTSDDDTILVHCDIVEFNLPDVQKFQEKRKKLQHIEDNMPKANETPSNYYVYDYIFSGKNSDIIHMDIKLNDYMFALQDHSKVGEIASWEVLKNGQKDQANEQKIANKTALAYARKRQPMIPVPRSKEEQINFATAATKGIPGVEKRMRDLQEFHAALCMIHALSMVNAKVRIRGNPEILGMTVLPTAPAHTKLRENLADYAKLQDFNDPTVQTSVQATKTQHRKWVDEMAKKIISNIDSANDKGKNKGDNSTIGEPLFVKINIFQPSDYLYSLSDKTAFSEKFFYDGWYWVTSIDNYFGADGQFTQELNLRSYDIYGQYLEAHPDDRKVPGK